MPVKKKKIGARIGIIFVAEYNESMERENNVFLAKTGEELDAMEAYQAEIDEDVSEEDGAYEMELIDAITWEAPEFEHIEKSTTWYWTSMSIAIVLIAIALWQKNFLFAVFIVIAELAIFMLAGEKPKMWQFSIDERGVTIEKHKTYKYKDILLYDIHAFSDEYDELVLRTRSKVQHYIKIFIPVEDEDVIVELLDRRVERGEIEVTLLELLERWVGF